MAKTALIRRRFLLLVPAAAAMALQPSAAWAKKKNKFKMEGDDKDEVTDGIDPSKDRYVVTYYSVKVATAPKKTTIDIEIEVETFNFGDDELSDPPIIRSYYKHADDNEDPEDPGYWIGMTSDFHRKGIAKIHRVISEELFPGDIITITSEVNGPPTTISIVLA